MDAYDLLQKRVLARGANVEERLANDKLKTLKKALTYSYQAETVSVDEVEFRALLNNNKLKMDYDDKIISIPFDSGFKVGTIFYWPRVDEHWIIYLRHYSEDAYFRGYVRRAQHNIRWEDKYGMIHETPCAVRGPVETKIKGEMKSGNAFDIPNYTLSIIVPHNEETNLLKRYSKVAISGKMWEVTVTDEISEPGVIGMELVEYYINKEEDGEVLNPIAPPNASIEGVTVQTPLDNVEAVQIAEPFRLWTIVEQNGVYMQELIDNAVFSVVDGSAMVTDNFLNVIEPPGIVSVKLEIPKIGFSKIFTFDAKALELPPATKYVVIGNETVKSFGKEKYQIKHFLDGFEDNTAPNGTWQVDINPNLFSVSSMSNEEIELAWKVGRTGKVKLEYVIDGNIVATKEIQVKSLI